MIDPRALSFTLLAGLFAHSAVADVIDVDVLGHTFQVVSPVPGQGTNHCTIQVGDTIRWTWRSDFHTVTADNNAFNSGMHNTGFVYSRTFTTAENFGYHCALHGAPGIGMHGTVTVVAASCYPNCDASTGTPLLTANDFQCFLNRFAANDTYANCDGSTGSPALTANDFQCFLNKYAAGCS